MIAISERPVTDNKEQAGTKELLMRFILNIEDDCAGGIGWIATEVSLDGTHDQVDGRGGYRNSFVGRAMLHGDMFKKALEYSRRGYAVDIEERKFCRCFQEFFSNFPRRKGMDELREIARQDEERLRFQIKDECLF